MPEAEVEPTDEQHLVNTYYSVCYLKPEPGYEVRSYGTEESARERISKHAEVMGAKPEEFHILEVTVRRHYRVL